MLKETGYELIKAIKEDFRKDTNETSRGITPEETGALLCHEILHILKKSIKREFYQDKVKHDELERTHHIVEYKLEQIYDILKESNIYCSKIIKN